MCRHLHTAIKGTSESLQHTPQVKICGITSVQDAKLAASAGADMLGMIMWQKAKRAVSASVARDIASVAEDHGIQSVGVFVDENSQQIHTRYVRRIRHSSGSAAWQRSKTGSLSIA